jgi:hypothetical protein
VAQRTDSEAGEAAHLPLLLLKHLMQCHHRQVWITEAVEDLGVEVVEAEDSREAEAALFKRNRLDSLGNFLEIFVWMTWIWLCYES